MRLKHILILLLPAILMGISPGVGTRADHGGPGDICVTPDGRNVPCSHRGGGGPDLPKNDDDWPPRNRSSGGAGCESVFEPAVVTNQSGRSQQTQIAAAQAQRRVLEGQSDEVTRFLGQLAGEWREWGDLRYGFAEVHQCMSQQITSAAKARRFRDPDWILRLNIRFGILFDRALDGWYERDSVRKQDVPKAWKQAFTWAENIQRDRSWPGGQDPRIARDRVTLVMASAHIFNDLTLALNKEGCGIKSDFQYIMDLVDRCELRLLGLAGKTIKDIAASLGVPGTNSIRQWRTSVWNYVCERGPHPGQVFR